MGHRDLPWAILAAGFALAGWLVLGRFGGSGVRVPLCVAGASILAVRPWLRGPRLALAGAIALLAWASVVLGALGGRGLQRTYEDPESHLDKWYRDALGPRYFAELGYRDLHDQAIAVDAEHARQSLPVKWIRDLRTLRREPMNYFSRIRSDAWSEARWARFSDDVLWLLGRLDEDDLERLLRDRGHDSPPARTALCRLAALLPATPQGLLLGGSIDLLLLAIAFILAWRVFGPLRCLLCSAGLLLLLPSETPLIEGPLQHDHMAALVLIACAVHSNRPMSAGLLLGYACMTRVYPVFMLAGVATWTLVAMRRDRAFPRFTERFARGLLAACAILFAVGCLAGRGVRAWPEWADGWSARASFDRFASRRIGLQHAFTHDWNLRLGDWRKEEWRRRTWPAQRGAWIAAAVLLTALWGAASLRGARGERDPLDSLVFSLALVLAWTVLARESWAAACLFLLVGGRERDGPREAWLGAGLLLLAAGVQAALRVVGSGFGSHFLADLLFVAWFAAVLGARIGARWPPARQARAAG